MELFAELTARGLVERTTSPEVEKCLNQGGLTFYVGFDPTADSLHVGQLAVFNLMQILQKGGHKPIGLAGGATGMIGDPGGKSAERNLLSKAQLDQNIAGIKKQIERFLDFEQGNKAILVNNFDWLSRFSYLDFLRDVGKLFSVNMMIARDSVKSRLERDGAGISYTEFSYMLLQSYDFYHLYQEHGCRLQVGGADQWGNIVSGIDLTRRLCQAEVMGFTMPLITKSDGNKFGKSEAGTIWLSAAKTSPYEFYQFFLNQGDEDVIRFLKVLTQVPLEEIAQLEEGVKNEPHLRAAQKRLAAEVTKKVHGQATLDKVLAASQALFGGSLTDLDDEMISQIFKDVPSLDLPKARLEAGWLLVDALSETGATTSKSQARKLVESGGAYVNNQVRPSIETSLGLADLASPRFLILRAGKKNYRLVRLVE